MTEQAGNSAEEGPQAEEVGLRARLAEEKRRSEELLTRLKYLQADFDNLRKRMDKEMKEVEEHSARSLVVRLLSVLEELELAVKHAEEDKGGVELKEGIVMVHKNLVSSLESVGLRRIESVGKPFDPALHEAVEKVQGSSEGDDVVVEEMRSGFTLRGLVIRPSMVKVELAMKKRGEEANASE